MVPLSPRLVRLVTLAALTTACAAPKGADPQGTCEYGLDMDADGICDREVADFSDQAELVPGEDRHDVFNLGEENLAIVRDRGLLHAFVWPVETSRLLLPIRPFESFLADPEMEVLVNALEMVAGFRDMDGLYERLGLPPFPDPAGPDALPMPPGVQAGDPMGAGIVSTEQGDGLVFSCAACHASQLFGRTVMGMTNRRARPNAFFHLAKPTVAAVPPDQFAELTGADEGETAMYATFAAALNAVGTKEPASLGLDTSLAQVSLSLARREADATATLSPTLEQDPTESMLETFIADSKPAVWWTTRYKTRWLLDGSIVSGNPIFTNFLWNEIGRGADLGELERWLEERQIVSDELTVAVFATESPRWEDWFGLDTLDIEAAKRGQAHYDQICADCHGRYEKGWEDPAITDPAEQVKNRRLFYHAATPVIDVGTDPQRAAGMEALAERLNALDISQWMGTRVAVVQGYIPPPLDGIWARYPYLHNNSVPDLCSLLRPAAERPALFVQGPAENPTTDYRLDCVGYPTEDQIPAAWWEDTEAVYDTTREGMSNAGHEDHLFDENGNPLLDDTSRAELISFLKTL